MEPPVAFILGFVGGVVADLPAIYGYRKMAPAQRPRWLKSGFYWSMVVVMSIIGGGLVLLYQSTGVGITPFLAVNIGVSAPLILESLKRVKPGINPGRVD